MADARARSTAAIVGAVASAVLIGSMFLDWYRVDLPQRLQRPGLTPPSFNAFEGLERTDVGILILAVFALVVALAMLADAVPRSQLPALALLGAGLLLVAVLAYRGVDRPPQLILGVEFDTTLRAGWFIALVASLAIAVAGLLALRTRTVPADR
jgi:ABC-type transport system involved in cytochrome c biogenesis permease subunit